MADTPLAQALRANRDFLRGIRLAGGHEPAWLAAVAVLAMCAFAAVLGATQAGLANALIGAVAHLAFALCIYLAAARGWVWRLALLSCLSAVNLLVYVWVGGPQIGVVLRVYGAIALAALACASLLHLRARRALAALGPTSGKDDFRWLVTSAPLAVRLRVRRLLNDAEPRQPQPDHI